MHFSTYVPVLGALFAGAQASPAPYPVGVSPNIASPKTLAGRSSSSTSFDLAKSYVQATLFDGLAPSVENGVADVNLHLGLPNAALSGNVIVELGSNFILDPTVIVNLGGVKAYIELDVTADAKVFTAVELVTSGQLAIDIPGLLDINAGLALALDLVISLDAAIDLSAGFYIDFPAGSFIEINLLTSKVVNHALDNLLAKTLPLSLGVDVELDVDVTLEVGLRLRTELGIEADVDPLGIPLLSAGAEVAVWINLFDYTSIIIGHPSGSECKQAVTEAFALDVGIIVELDVDVLDIINLDLAPTISVTLASAPAATSCIGSGSSSSSAASSSATASSSGAGASSSSSAGGNGGSSSSGSGATSSSGSGSGATSSSGSGSGASSSSGAGGSVSTSTTFGTSTVTIVSSSGTTVTSTDNGASSAFTHTSISRSAQTVTSTIGSGASSGGAGAISATTKGPNQSQASLSTSTYYETTLVTITSCAASVVNCPASYTQKVVTQIVVAKTTICPVALAASSSIHWAGNSTSATSAPVTVVAPASASNTVTFTTYPASSAPCNTFTAPTGASSVVGTVTLTGTPATITPVGTPAPPLVSVPATALVTAKPSASKPGSGWSSTTTLPVTAGAAGLATTHAGVLLALVAGLMLAL